jgi:hypothetical protein
VGDEQAPPVLAVHVRTEAHGRRGRSGGVAIAAHYPGRGHRQHLLDLLGTDAVITSYPSVAAALESTGA